MVVSFFSGVLNYWVVCLVINVFFKRCVGVLVCLFFGGGVFGYFYFLFFPLLFQPFQRTFGHLVSYLNIWEEGNAQLHQPKTLAASCRSVLYFHNRRVWKLHFVGNPAQE